MDPTIINPAITIEGRPTPLADGLRLAAGQATVVTAGGLSGGGKLQLSLDDAASGLRGIGYDDSPPDYAIPWLVGDVVGPAVLVLEHRRGGEQVSKRAYKLSIDKAGPTAKPAPAPAPVKRAKWQRFGACFFFGDGAGWVRAGQRVGMTHFRSFGESVAGGGAVPKDAFAKQRAILDACPAAILVGCHGPSERGYDVFTPADYGRFCAAYRPRLQGYESRYAWELPNEVNLPEYLRVGQNGNRVNDGVVKWTVDVAKAARLALGEDITIVGPSIGWGSETIHIAYAKAFVEAGLLSHIDVYNDHTYPARGLPQVRAQLGGVRGAIGMKFPFWNTEISWKYTHRSLWPEQGPAMAAAVQEFGVLPFAYRLKPRGDSAMDDRALFDAAGVPDRVIADAWGLQA